MSAPVSNPKKQVENPHKDHRKRMLARYDTYGFGPFSDHNVLELLLFYSIPRADTNPTAHALIDQFGSIYDVMIAPHEELTQVKGVGTASATLLRALFDAARTASIRKIAEKPITTYDRLIRIAVDWYADKPRETVAILLMDNERRFIDIIKLAERDCIVPPSYTEAILSQCQARHASHIVLMHNHKNGRLAPSESDLYTTEHLYHALSKAGVTLMEHLIVCEFDVLPILDQSVGSTVSQFPRVYL